jgi:hypothetical protein
MEELEIVLASDAPGIGVKGQRVTLALQPEDVHDPSEIPTYLAGYTPFGYRADEASKAVLVDRDEDKFRQFDSDDAFESIAVKGSTQGAVPEVDPKSALETYKVVERYVGSFIPVQTQMNASNPNFDPRMAAARRCRRALQLDREIDVWGLLGIAGSWTAANVNAAPAVWSGVSDPIKDLQDLMEESAQQITEFWMNQRVANAFIRNDAVKDHMRQHLGDGPSNQQTREISLAGTKVINFEIPGIPVIRVAAAKKKISPGVLDYILTDVVVGLTTLPGVPVDGEEIASTWTFRRKGPSGTGFESREFFVPGRGPLGGTMVVVSQADIAKMTASNAGGLITGVL